MKHPFALMNAVDQASANAGSAGPSFLRVLILGLLTLLPVFGAQAQTPPALVSVTPADGATLVPASASLVFVFDQEMETATPLFPTIPGVLVGNFEVTAPGVNVILLTSWGSDKKSLILRPSLPLPIATFSWTLNPVGGLFTLKSKAGMVLPLVRGSFSTGSGVTDPVLVSSNPANNATGVAREVVITFTFDQPMRTNTAIGGNPPSTPAAILWTGVGLDVTKFRYTWSANSRSLHCDYVGDLPGNTEIFWSLNPPVSPVKIENAAGKVLPSSTYSGRFTTGSGVPCDPPPQPPDQGSYTLYKASNFFQEGAGDPLPLLENAPFVLGAMVQGSSLGPAPTAGSLTSPAGTSTPLSLIAGLYLLNQQPFDTEAELEAAAPAGDYRLRFTLGSQPETGATLTLPAASPPVPRIANLAAGQNIRWDADFTLSWNPLTGVGPNDSIAVTLVDAQGRVVFSAPDPCVPRELAPTATSVVIPAKTLATNSVVSGSLVFSRNFFFSTNAVPKMFGLGNIVRSTQFNLKTQGGGGANPPVAARLTNPRLLPNGNPAFDLTGTAGARYGVQRTSQPGVGATWTTVVTVTLDASGRGSAEDADAARSFPAYYRAVAE